MKEGINISHQNVSCASVRVCFSVSKWLCEWMIRQVLQRPHAGLKQGPQTCFSQSHVCVFMCQTWLLYSPLQRVVNNISIIYALAGVYDNYHCSWTFRFFLAVSTWGWMSRFSPSLLLSLILFYQHFVWKHILAVKYNDCKDRSRTGHKNLIMHCNYYYYYYCCGI